MNLRYGAIEQQNLLAQLHVYRVRMSTGELSPWMPALVTVAGTDRHNHAISIGSQVAVLLNDYEGVILGALNYDLVPAVTDRDTLDRNVYSDGAIIEYDSLNHQLNATLPAGATTQLISDGGVAVTGDVTVTGKIHATDDISSDAEVIDAVRAMSGDRTIYNGHDHNDPQGGTVSPPNQQQ